ncbi:MAG: UDP-N-acetylmuramoyl-L-alanyl-D-glutamate-2,6-diaminopimelate ligase [Candidatus Wolfebacteria bacterium GW2011_GWB1_41_12]|uniref:UDP-N-acetylmuramoyl-L-alanyl-D-glutamate-2, 6-diaminopimelate ligase n=1 Tax=Candidatus Wolfebacteria bacterium GW2011_GWB1_41_12 TaxID=1619006 RepID=A0A0G0UIR0_9BACT|nr:MAG: UDP-N-acetylmuramoyl-L-alanyl-D-glutamate-2,6-diaminopimelate ligase [Candidatus Wolfebacteria bacterium GW2011_GWB1_41_12]
MITESWVDKILYRIKKIIPKRVFNFFAPYYHALLSHAGAAYYRFPSNSMKVIGVTGTKGKSTTVYMISKLLEEAGNKKVAAIGSLGFKILDKEWPNTLKMTMPGRFRIHKFMARARDAGCEFCVLEVTSEGIKQRRHLGINFDCAVFTNLHKEHIESHGSFDNYKKAKQELFKRTKNIHVLNGDDMHVEDFMNYPARKKVFYGISRGDIKAEKVQISPEKTTFIVYGTEFVSYLSGKFNVLNCLAALSTVAMYGIDLPTSQPIIAGIRSIPGRMEYIQKQPFAVVVDYAHTPDSLREVYHTLKSQLAGGKLIGVLGAAGGGRDKWKRSEFGEAAAEYLDEIILTNEDPYEENPESIISQIAQGLKGKEFRKLIDRKEAIGKAISLAEPGDTVVITGKGSEISMAVAGGKKIPWSDKEIVLEFIKKNE